MRRYADILEEWKAYGRGSKPCIPPHSSGTRLEQALSRASYSREFIAVRRLPTGWQRLESSSRGLDLRRKRPLRNVMTVGSKRAWNKVLMDRHWMRMTHASRKVLEECGVVNGPEYVEVEGDDIEGETSDTMSIARGVVLGNYGPDFGLPSSSSSPRNGFFMVDVYRLVHSWVEVKGLLPHVGILTRVESFGRDDVLLSLLVRLGSGLVCVSSEDLASILNRNNNNNNCTLGRKEIHDQHCCRTQTHMKELSKCIMVNSVAEKKQKSSSECDIATVSVDSCDEGVYNTKCVQYYVKRSGAFVSYALCSIYKG